MAARTPAGLCGTSAERQAHLARRPAWRGWSDRWCRPGGRCGTPCRPPWSRPVPSDTSKCSSVTLRKLSALCPSGMITRRQHRRIVLRVLAQDLEPPRPHRAAHALGMPVVAREHVVEALLVQHVDGLGQAVQQVGAPACRGRSRPCWRPIISSHDQNRLGQLGRLGGGQRLVAHGIEATRPGGSISPFCEPATVTSTPHSSCR